MHTEIATTVVLPGWVARCRRRWLSVALLVTGVIVPLAPLVYAVATSRNWVALTLDTSFLDLVIVAGLAAIVARLVALAEVWVAAGRRASFDRAETLVGAAAVLALVVGAVVVVEVSRARAAIAPTFTPIDDSALFEADGTEVVDVRAPQNGDPEPVSASSTSTSTTLAPASGGVGPEVPDVWTCPRAPARCRRDRPGPTRGSVPPN